MSVKPLISTTRHMVINAIFNFSQKEKRRKRRFFSDVCHIPSEANICLSYDFCDVFFYFFIFFKLFFFKLEKNKMKIVLSFINTLIVDLTITMNGFFHLLAKFSIFIYIELLMDWYL